MNRWRWLLLAWGLVVFVVDVREDAQVYDLAVGLGWTAEGVRMVVGHALREVLVGVTLLTFALDSNAMLPFVLGAALHGLLIRAAFFHGAGGVPPLGWYSAFVCFDVVWRVACLEYVWRRRHVFLSALAGREGAA